MHDGLVTVLLLALPLAAQVPEDINGPYKAADLDVEHYEDMLASIHSALVPGGKLVVVEFDRVEDESPDFVLEHIRASKAQFTREIEAAGFRMTADVTMDGMEQTLVRHFERL